MAKRREVNNLNHLKPINLKSYEEEPLEPDLFGLMYEAVCDVLGYHPPPMCNNSSCGNAVWEPCNCTSTWQGGGCDGSCHTMNAAPVWCDDNCCWGEWGFPGCDEVECSCAHGNHWP